MKTKISPSQLKQEILNLYNTVNQEIFGIGIRSQRVEVMENKGFIYATHNRIQPLKVLDESQRMLTRILDNAIMEENKAMLAKRLEEHLQLPPVIIFTENLESWANEAGNRVSTEAL